ncbi:NAD(P)H-binding protein, partial [Terribacillus sp. 7520-G]|uniref:NAD(P)H-binding protein n=2 Tax=Bacillaceae TaxID=186817 RepID=UPI000BDA24F6
MQTGQKKRPVVALTGASSHIGSHLLDKLKGRFDIIALSHSADKRESTEHVTWRSCDLFSQIDTEKGLYGADIAVYLVHSMRPSAKLTQARDEDMDVILADNFAQAAKKNGVKQIIYLSGIIPPEEKRSRHLRTKSEAEKILGSYGVSVTTVRTGLIVGSIGASAEKSDKQLPVILSSWTRHCQKTKLPSRQDVRSIQRMPLPDAKDANWAARHYMSWLSDSLRPFVRTAIDEHLNCKIYLTVTKKPLLILSY